MEIAIIFLIVSAGLFLIGLATKHVLEGIKTYKEEVIKKMICDANIPLRTFENQLQKLLALGHAKKAKFTNEHGRPKWYFWINKLSDEYQD